jgi:hypothetical protein
VQPPVFSGTLDGHRLPDVGPSIHTTSMSRSAIPGEPRRGDIVCRCTLAAGALAARSQKRLGRGRSVRAIAGNRQTWRRTRPYHEQRWPEAFPFRAPSAHLEVAEPAPTLDELEASGPALHPRLLLAHSPHELTLTHGE